MSIVLSYLVAVLPSVICAAGAVYIAHLGMSGWVWGSMLVASVCLYPSFRTGKAAELHAQKELEESRRGSNA